MLPRIRYGQKNFPDPLCRALRRRRARSHPAFVGAARPRREKPLRFDSDLYRRFTDPASTDRPFVRWWWNGDRVKADELVRELRLLHAAGVGGVEINPVKFPEEADPLDTHPLRWLSPEWIDMLKAAFDEAKRLGMTCDLIVGSGWPFGAEYLEGDERGQVMVVAVKKTRRSRDGRLLAVRTLPGGRSAGQ